MSEEELKRKARVLGKDLSIKILKYLNSVEWVKASDISYEYGHHIATASRYLEDLYRIGLVDKREGWGKTRKVKEYRLKETKITFSMDIGGSSEKTDADKLIDFYRRLYNSLLEVSDLIPDIEDETLDETLGYEQYTDKTLDELKRSISDLLQIYEQEIGSRCTSIILGQSFKHVLEGMNLEIEDQELLKILPEKYIDLIEVKKK